jgi:hypothetical protein
MEIKSDLDALQFVEKNLTALQFVKGIEALRAYLQKRLYSKNENEIKIISHVPFYTHGSLDKEGNLRNVVTLATVVQENKICSAISVCSAYDKYDRKKGNTIALGRAKIRPLQVVDIIGDKSDKKSVLIQLRDVHTELCGEISGMVTAFIQMQSTQERIADISKVAPYKILVH